MGKLADIEQALFAVAYVWLRQLKESPAYTDLEVIKQAENWANLILYAFKSTISTKLARLAGTRRSELGVDRQPSRGVQHP